MKLVAQKLLLNLSAAAEVKEESDVMALDVPSVFLQTSLPKDKTAEQRFTMKLRGNLVDALE